MTDDADSPDLDALAKQYLDLWQEQLAGLASDETVARTMAQTVELMNASAAAVAAMAAAQAESPSAPRSGERAGEPAGPVGGSGRHGPGGAAPAGAAPGAANLSVDELARRLERLEERLAALEAAVAEGGGRPAGQPRKRRS